MSKTMSAQESLQFVHDELNLTWDEIADRIGVFCGARGYPTLAGMVMAGVRTITEGG